MGGVLIGAGMALAIGGYAVGLATSPSHDPKLARWCGSAMWGGVVLAAAVGLIKLAGALL